ncbi:ATPase family AAA domain-containing protein 5 [Camponotus floridanus]|uniref:ATPase family AAA domain-containing protein 5 n=1 Tax=Camponotus floridanus TaxID=104421 RepID=E2A6X2_CAMFO|nr:ATPase family AAA domain-containing protein 5 [Camponotus floridanus]
MKDIKQYFSNGTKIVDERDATDLDNAVEQKEEKQWETISTGKRKRVKIRISRTSSKERTCDIVDNKNDLIDKTPSPFNGKIKKNGEKIVHDETPKIKSKRNLKKDPKLAIEINGNQSEDAKYVLQNKEEPSEQIIDFENSINNSENDINKIEDIGLCSIIGSQREESNAFQLLMNRGKPIQYKLLPQQSMEDIKCKEKLDNIKDLRAKHKEKMIALADKKGYLKKKIAEMEEGERIEKNIENRMKFFKSNITDDSTPKRDNTELLIKNNKQQSGNLLDYFSKSSLESTNKDEKYASTFIVKADVHRSDNSDIEPIVKSISNVYSNKSSKSELNLPIVDDIHIIASEHLTQTVKPYMQKREKPRWSLRIKLHSSEDSLNDMSDEELFSPRSKSKFNASSKSRNSVNMEDNRVCSKDYNGHIKTKVRNKEKKESIEQKEDNIQNTAKDAIVINNSRNARTKRSSEIVKSEQNDKNEMIIIDSDSEIIDNENVLKRKSNEKLAPLFTKRRKINPIVAAARRSFLQSDMIDMENKKTDYKANSNNSTFTLPFPIISHVTQLENTSDSIRAEINKTSKTIEVNINEPVKGNFDQVLSEIEELCPDARKMWKTISKIKNDSEKRSPSRMKGRKTRTLERKKREMLTERIENEESRSHDCAWTCKYKPKSAEEIIGNEEAAGKLKDWLSGWRAFLTKEDDGSSGDEFYSSDCSTSCNNRENNQIAVLLGPHGSGKTASVYAIAEELGYSVLEVNASSRRTGKKILKELEEATKSHRIKKSKHKSPFERVANEDETLKISQNSLILLEDIDLIFEEDEGFVSAAYQLASNTKRPIVMTCRDICPHLSKMAPQQNRIYFQKVDNSRVSALLELISLAEANRRVPYNCLVKLLQMGDLRQALLQSQYLFLSGPSILCEQYTTVKPLWQSMQYYLYKPAIKLNRHRRKNRNTKRTNDTICILNNLAENLDSLSLVSSLIDIEDPILNISEEKTQPNLSLAENVSFYSASHDLQADIANFISDRILCNDSNANEHVQNQNNIILRKRLNRGVDLALSHVTFACLDQRIMALDYLPTIRTICRAEEFRSTLNFKRSNRFFHYLHSLNVPTASMKPNILAAACKMLQERENKNVST